MIWFFLSKQNNFIILHRIEFMGVLSKSDDSAANDTGKFFCSFLK